MTLLLPHCSHPCLLLTSWARHPPPSSLPSSKCSTHSPPTNSLLYVTPRSYAQATMAAIMPATPTTSITATTTTVPLPNYQVSGAGAVAAAAPRHGASSGSGSVGAFFGVLAAVLVLTVLSCFFGRVCAAQAQGPDESYDCTRLARWRRSAHRGRPVVPAAETKQPAAPPPLPLPLPEP